LTKKLKGNKVPDFRLIILFLPLPEPKKLMKKPLVFLLYILTGVIAYGQNQPVNHWETAVFNNDKWSYFAENSQPDHDWRLLSYNDTAWLKGQGGFGYGDNDDNTVISHCYSVYLRHRFNVADTSKIAMAVLDMDYDDGFIAYLNNIEIARVGISGVNPPYDALANDHEATMYRGGSPESFIIDKSKLKLCLKDGENVLAIEVHNSSATSSDLSSNAFLSFGITDGSVYFRAVPMWFNPPLEFTSSNLPIVIITTQSNETIMDEPKIEADMKIIDHGASSRNYVTDEGNVYSGKIGIEIRGHYSATLPQKPFGLETRDSLGNNRNVSLLGMPEENDWVLLANYNDKSFLRNVLAMDISHKMGYYAPRMRYCEVVINNEYLGIYLLGEKIKRDKHRVNIAKLAPDDNSGNALTGGYIFKNDFFNDADSWISNYSPIFKPGAEVRFVYEDPKAQELTTQQKEYLKNYVNSVESTIYSYHFRDPVTGYKAYLDVKSFVDYFILEEVCRNVDAYKKSRFYYKDRASNGGLLHSGPVWDFDWAWKNLTENCVNFNQTDGSGWAYLINECDAWPVPPTWEVRLLQDDDFADRIHDRYFELRKTILSNESIFHTIDSVAGLLEEAQQRHFQKWQILGINVGTPEPDPQPATFVGEIDKLKTWIDTRMAWLDSNMIGAGSAIDGNYTSEPALLRAFPNPVNGFLYLESNKEIDNITFFSMRGTIVRSINNCSTYSLAVDVAGLKPGIYLVKVSYCDGEIVTSRVIKK
jgi:hypothetical protein